MSPFLSRTLTSCAALAISGLPLAAEQIYLDDPAGCAQVLGSEDGLLDYAADGGLILGAAGYSSLEYLCSYAPPVRFDWSNYKVSDRIGHCEEPGPFYQPQLFTIVTDPEQPGIISIWTGNEGDPLRFHACAS
jgi:hypothetical protein